MKTIVLTGLIGSGKSAVAVLLRRRGVPVYDSDSCAKQLYARRPALVRRMEEALGTPIRTAEGKLDKRLLAAAIFSDEQAREKVEALVYPVLLQDFKRWRGKQEGAPFVVLESAVILSKPLFDGLWDAVVVVTAPREVRLRRVMARDGASEEAVLARMAAQDIPHSSSQVLLPNEGTPEALEAAVERVFFRKNGYICKLLKSSEK